MAKRPLDEARDERGVPRREARLAETGLEQAVGVGASALGRDEDLEREIARIRRTLGSPAAREAPLHGAFPDALPPCARTGSSFERSRWSPGLSRAPFTKSAAAISRRPLGRTRIRRIAPSRSATSTPRSRSTARMVPGRIG